MMIGLMLSIKKFKLSGTYLRQQRIIFSYSLVGASQVFPTFDVFHAWYASAPIIIAIPSILKESRLQLKLSRNSIWKLNTALIIAMFTFFLFQAFQSISVEKKPFPLKEVRGIYLSEQQASDLHKEFAFFRRHIPRNAVILNVCGNPDPFFPQGYWSPGSRFFVFWPAISNYNFFPEDSYEVDFIIKCTEPGQNDWLNEVLSRNKFSKIETSGDVVSWGLRWEIYSRSSR
jgi:hypothetical protein